MKLKPQMAEAVQGCDSAVSCQTYGTGYTRLGCKREHTNHKATFQIKSVHSRKSYSEYQLYPFTDLFSKGYLKNNFGNRTGAFTMVCRVSHEGGGGGRKYLDHQGGFQKM